jgi:xylulokinase
VTLLGIDLGTSSVKALLLDDDATVVSQATRSYRVRSPHAGWAESDPSEWLEAVTGAAEAAVQRREVTAVGLSGQMHGVVLARTHGTPVRPAVLWADGRAAREVDAFRALPAEVIDPLGNPLAPGMAGPLLLWFARRDPDALAEARWALQPKDWLRLVFTGEAAAEPTDASATLLWDIEGDGWHEELIERLGVAPELLPPLVATDAAIPLTRQGADLLAVSAGARVAAGAADTAAAMLGAGLVEDGVGLNLGTGGQLVAPTARPLVHPGRLTHVYRAVTSGWYSMAAVQNVGLALDWAIRVLGASWDEIDAALASTRPGADGALFLPYLSGERTPVLDPDLRASWTGIGLEHGREHLLRAVTEGVAFSIRAALEALEGLGVEAAEPRVTGGGSVAGEWRQLLADVLGRPLAGVDAPAASARGAALLAGVAAGLWSSGREAASAHAPAVAGVTGPREADAYEDAYARFRHATADALTTAVGGI